MRWKTPVIIAFAALTPLLVAGGNYQDLWATVLLYAVVATALNLVTGLAGQLSIGHGALMGTGAFAAGILATRTDAGISATVLVSLGAGALIGLAFGAPALRVRGQYLALVTIGGGFIFVRLVEQGGELTGGVFGLIDVSPLQIAGSQLTLAGHAWASFALFVLVLFASFNLTRSPAGRALAALKDSEVGAETAGVNVFAMKLGIFVLSSCIAALAGLLFAHKEGFLAPRAFGLELSLLLLMACIVGGLGHPAGGAIGVMVFVAPFLFFPRLQEYQLLVLGPIALVFLFVLPEGVGGGLRRLRGLSGLGSLRRTAGSIKPVPRDGREFSISAKGVSKKFGGVSAVQSVSITVEPAKIHALIGPNGSGKTTLVDCITGVHRPDMGEVFVGERSITGSRPHIAARLGVARTFQTGAGFGSLSVLESISMGARIERPVGLLASSLSLPGTRRADSQAMSLTLRAIDSVGLKLEGDPFSSEISFGESRRLEIARAIVARPAILILDEPGAGLNETELVEIGNLLGSLRQEGVGILLVDHHINWVLELADVVTVLDGGRVVGHGDPDHVRSDPEVMRAYLGQSR